jgi:hypothetical protein
VLIDNSRDMRVPVSGLGGLNLDPWRGALDTLLADPQAVISIDDLLPPALPQRPPMMVTTFAVTPPDPAKARFLGPLQPASDPEEAA